MHLQSESSGSAFLPPQTKEACQLTPKSCLTVFHSISDGSVPALLPRMRDGGN